jgi:hypothetical protein
VEPKNIDLLEVESTMVITRNQGRGLRVKMNNEY